MRLRSPHGPAGMLAAAASVSARAAAVGCGIDEAADGIGAQSSPTVTRRHFLQGAGGAGAGLAALAMPSWLAAPANAATRSGGRGERIVIVGSGIAGLGCAYRLWREHGIHAEVYEVNPERAGGRLQTLRGFFDGDEIAEQHAEFISSEHVRTLALGKSLGLHVTNVGHYGPGTHAGDYTLRFDGKPWPQQGLTRAWHEFGWELFHDAAFHKAPWPTTHDSHTAAGLQWDHMSVPEWIDAYVPGGLESDFGKCCIAVALDEWGGPPEEQSALNLVYTLGQYDSVSSGRQPFKRPQLSGSDEKWHFDGGNDQLISGLLERLPAGTVRLGQELVAMRSRGHGRYALTFSSGVGTRDVVADQVVLTLPFTRLRQVDLSGVDISPLHRRAIREQPLGANCKIALQFDTRVWNTLGSAGNLYSSDLAQTAWDSTSYQHQSPLGLFVAFPGGSTGTELGRRYGLQSYFGPAPEPMVQDYLRCFEHVYPGMTAAYNGKAYYRWPPGDPYLLGAYSYFKRGQYTGFNGIQGAREGNIHFGGEQTSLNYNGYVEGGLRSGYRCAYEIAG